MDIVVSNVEILGCGGCKTAHVSKYCGTHINFSANFGLKGKTYEKAWVSFGSKKLNTLAIMSKIAHIISRDVAGSLKQTTEGGSGYKPFAIKAETPSKIKHITKNKIKASLVKDLYQGELEENEEDAPCCICENVTPHCLDCWHCEECCGNCACCCNNSHCLVCQHTKPIECAGNICACSCCKHCLKCEITPGHLCVEDCTCCCFSKKKTMKSPDFASVPIDGEFSQDIAKFILKNSEKYPVIFGNKYIVKDIAKFYMLLAIGDESLLNPFAKDLATRLLNYMVMSCAGESRYLASNHHMNGSLDDVSEDTAIYGATLSKNKAVGNKNNRRTMWDAMYELCQKYGYSHMLGILVEVFNNWEWIGGGIGGKKWGNIAYLAKQYADGELDDIIFIDGVMNVVHNGGWAFNKYYSQSVSYKPTPQSYEKNYSLNELLNLKRKATENSIFKLLKYCSIANKTDLERRLWEEGIARKAVTKEEILALKTDTSKPLQLKIKDNHFLNEFSGVGTGSLNAGTLTIGAIGTLGAELTIEVLQKAMSQIKAVS